MPYAPGVQDISGQLLGRGIEAAAQARAQGMGAIGNTISNLFGQYTQKRAQDEEFMAKAKSMENFIKTHADDFAPIDPQTGQKNSEAVLQFLQQSPDENAKQKYMRLGTFLDAAVTGTKVQQQAAAAKFETARANQAEEELRRTKQWIAQFAPQNAQAQTQQLAPTVPGGQVGVQPEAFESMSDEALVQTPQAKKIAQDMYLETGKIPSGSAITGRMREMASEQRKAQAERSMFTSPEAALRAAQEDKRKGLLPEGQEFQVKFNTQTGKYYYESGPGLEPVATAAAREGAKKSAELEAQSQADYLKQVRQEGAGASDSRFQNQEIRKLLNEGVRTGPIEGIKAQAKKVAANFGLADESEIESANSYDKLDSIMMRGQIETAQAATRGNLNTFEQQLVQRAVANAQSKLPGANAYLNDVNEAILAKKEDRFREERRLRKEKVSKEELVSRLQDWELAPENSINRYFQTIRASSAAPAAAAPLPSAAAPTTTTSVAPAAGPVTVTSQAQYDALPVGTQYRDSQGKLATKRGK